MHVSSSSLERTISVSFAHRIFFTRSVFSRENRLLADLLLERGSVEMRESSAASCALRAPGQQVVPATGELRCAKVLVVIDEAVARAFPRLAEEIAAYFSGDSGPAALVAAPLVVPGGEAVKNSRDAVERLYREIERHGIDRHSYLIAVGGGALLDAAGFAAATAHRGVRHIRVPTTTLSQADGGVGVKNGINAFGKKNFIGTFAPPFAVINDSDFLEPLPAAEKRAGLIEAIKVALIRDAEFFAEIERASAELARFEREALERAVRRCAELHVEHISTSGDPFELGSARPLDFGHWSAHKLEQMSGFAISHGAAVAQGIALDVIYSAKRGLLSVAAAERVLTLIGKLGFALFDPLMAQPGLLDGLEEFREHLGGELTVTLLREIGRGEEVHEIDMVLMRESILELERRAGAF